MTVPGGPVLAAIQSTRHLSEESNGRAGKERHCNLTRIIIGPPEQTVHSPPLDPPVCRSMPGEIQKTTAAEIVCLSSLLGKQPRIKKQR